MSGQKPTWLDLLDETDREIVKRLSRGESNGEIAYAVCRCEQAVKNRLTRIYAALGTNNRVALARRVWEAEQEDAA